MRLPPAPLPLALLTLAVAGFSAPAGDRPHIVLVMADDMGWGQTGYRGHPVLKTPNLDAMAAAGLRFERFYAGAPVCSPTRASVLTGRTNDRTGARSHGYALRPQEKTLPQALRAAGYVTGHFGKWHLNGLAGPGVPVLASDERHPGRFGFDEWLSTTNFFDLNPLLSRQGRIEEFKGDSSEIIVDEALRFLRRHRDGGRPMFAVVWFGSPHNPFRALPPDKASFGALNAASANHHGELVAMDRSIGTLRRGLREIGVAERTLLVFCSDNGGLPEIQPSTVGDLRGHKGSVHEGGLRVPGIIEWPAVIKAPRITSYPACTMDLFPTIADIMGLPADVLLRPVDGISLRPLFRAELPARSQPIGFRYQGRAAWVDNRYKLVADDLSGQKVALYDLETDPAETKDLAAEKPELFARMRTALLAWNASVEASVAGRDYPEGKVVPADPERTFWNTTAAYQPFLEEWGKRPEYETFLKNRGVQSDADAPKAKKKARRKSG